MKVIMLSGFAKSGKDTFANHIIKNHRYTRMAFADPLKDSTSIEYNIPRNYFDDLDFKDKPILHLPIKVNDNFALNLANFMYKEFKSAGGCVPTGVGLRTADNGFTGVIDGTEEQLYHTPRSLMILKGSVNRFVKSNYWTKKCIDKIRLTNNTRFVIADWRYKSEHEQFKIEYDFRLVTVRINRFDSTESKDSSENDLNDFNFDIVIDNKTTIEDFTSKINNLKIL